MSRVRKKKNSPESPVEVAQEPTAEVAVEASIDSKSTMNSHDLSNAGRSSTVAADREFTPIEAGDFVTDRQDGQSNAAKASRGQFRSWVTDSDRGYTRLTDEHHHRIVVQFAQRPPADVLTALNDGGFRFQPDYCGQKNAWVRRNDFEGRIQVEAIEKLFNELVPGRGSPSV